MKKIVFFLLALGIGIYFYQQQKPTITPTLDPNPTSAAVETTQEKINALMKKRDALLEKASKMKGAGQFDLKSQALDVMQQLEQLQSGAKKATEAAQPFSEATFADTVEAQKAQFGISSTDKEIEKNTKNTAKAAEKTAKSTEKLANAYLQPPVYKMA